jgi:hypothetical protein
MKKLLFLGALLSLIKVSSAQSDFKLQVYGNCALFNPNSYSNAIRFGIETVKPKWNYSLEYIEFYPRSFSFQNYYVMDSNLYKQTNYSYRSIRGLNLGISKAIQFKSYKTRFIYGIQVFGGANNYGEHSMTVMLDSNYLNPYYSTTGTKKEVGWNKKNNFDESHYERHLSLGIALMAKLELTISKRFTLSPAVYLPYMIHNESRSRFTTIDPGLSFLLGYQFLN